MGLYPLAVLRQQHRMKAINIGIGDIATNAEDNAIPVDSFILTCDPSQQNLQGEVRPLDASVKRDIYATLGHARIALDSFEETEISDQILSEVQESCKQCNELLGGESLQNRNEPEINVLQFCSTAMLARALWKAKRTEEAVCNANIASDVFAFKACDNIIQFITPCYG